MVLSVTLDLSTRASGRVAKNRAQGEAECSIFSDETVSECAAIQCYTKNTCVNCFVIILRMQINRAHCP